MPKFLAVVLHEAQVGQCLNLQMTGVIYTDFRLPHYLAALILNAQAKKRSYKTLQSYTIKNPFTFLGLSA
jgi:hypothetical protein